MNNVVSIVEYQCELIETLDSIDTDGIASTIDHQYELIEQTGKIIASHSKSKWLNDHRIYIKHLSELANSDIGAAVAIPPAITTNHTKHIQLSTSHPYRTTTPSSIMQ